MNQLLWLSLQSFGFSLVLTPIVRDVFRSYKVVDKPDQGRKVHEHPIPRVGGIAIALAYAIAFFINMDRGGQAISEEMSVVVNLFPAALTVFATGVIDDFFGLKPWQKLIGQIVAAGLFCWSGAVIETAGGFAIPAFLTVPVTMGWLLLCINAFNLVDGLDGLAAGIALFATLTVVGTALLKGDMPLAYAALPLAGCLLGFLCFNFSPATVFLGDGGSLLIGFLLGCFSVLWSHKSVTLLGITAPLMALSIPLIDVMLCIVRRWLSDRPIFGADRGHIHHRLLDRGLTTRQAVLILYGFCALGAVFSIVQSFADDLYVAGGVALIFLAAVWTGVHHLNYAELMVASRLLRTGELQRGVNARLNLSAFEKSLEQASSLDDCCETIARFTPTFGFAAVRICIRGTIYESWPESVAGPRFWVMRLPVSRTEYIEFARETGQATALPMAAIPFLDAVAALLPAKLREYDSSSAEAAPAVTLG